MVINSTNETDFEIIFKVNDIFEFRYAKANIDPSVGRTRAVFLESCITEMQALFDSEPSVPANVSIISEVAAIVENMPNIEVGESNDGNNSGTTSG